MFTVKATYLTGHTVYSCHSYKFEKTNTLDGCQSLVLWDGQGDVMQTILITGTIYVMNENGKTVDTFHARPDPRIQQSGGTPEIR